MKRPAQQPSLPAPAAPLSRDQRAALQRRRAAGALLLFVLLALAAVQAARLGVSGALVQMAQLEIDRWNPLQVPLDSGRMLRAEAHLSDSLNFAADNPWALEQIGVLDLARMRASIVPREALAAAQDARARFRQALMQRPASPFLWANLALAKLYLDQIDAEFFSALRHAGELGPWEPAIQQTTLFVGLATWDRLDAGLRQALEQAVERGALHNARNIYEIVKSYRRYDLLCGIKKYNDMSGLECKRRADLAKGGSGNARNGADDRR
jgi:hypothetical protein